jgi:hypothetical protein
MKGKDSVVEYGLVDVVVGLRGLIFPRFPITVSARIWITKAT